MCGNLDSKYIAKLPLTTWNNARYALGTLSKLMSLLTHDWLRARHTPRSGVTEGLSVAPEVLSTHRKNRPPKNCTPMMPKMSQNTRHTSSTLKMEGMADIRAFTTIWTYTKQGRYRYVPQRYKILIIQVFYDI